jgi:hypothetical protein
LASSFTARITYASANMNLSIYVEFATISGAYRFSSSRYLFANAPNSSMRRSRRNGHH